MDEDEVVINTLLSIKKKDIVYENMHFEEEENNVTIIGFKKSLWNKSYVRKYLRVCNLETSFNLVMIENLVLAHAKKRRSCLSVSDHV